MSEEKREIGTATGDCCSLFANMGVVIHPRFASPGHENKLQSSRLSSPPVDEEQDGKCPPHMDRRNSCCCELGHRLKVAMFVTVLLSSLTAIFGVSSLVYALHLGQVQAVQVHDLRERVDRCGLSEDNRGAAQTGDAGSAIPGPHGFPWQQNAHEGGDRLQKWVDDASDDYDDGDDGDDGDESDDDDDGNGEDWLHYALFGNSRQKRSSNGKKQKNGGGKHCKRLEKCQKAKRNGKRASKKCDRLLKCIPPSTGPKAMHFTSDLGQGNRQRHFGKDMPLPFSKHADWMKFVYKDKSQQPIIPKNDGGFIVTQSGIYLISSSVLYRGLKPRQSQALVVNGEKRLKCMDSVDYVAPNASAKYKTCSFTGVIYLKVNDRLEIQNQYAQTEVDLVSDGTYISLVLLTPAEIDLNA